MRDAPLPLATREPADYPTSDSRPVGETTVHFRATVYVCETLSLEYEDRPDVLVCADLLVHYERGNRRRHLSPDVFVAFGTPKAPPRDHYLLWEEPVPAFVLEVTSASTRDEDLGIKRRLYARWGVREYFLFDPKGEYLAPALQGFRLPENGAGGRYERLPETHLPNGAPGLWSRTLGLFFAREGRELRLYAPDGRPLPTRAEERAARLAAEDQAAQAKVEIDQLRALVRRLRRKSSK